MHLIIKLLPRWSNLPSLGLVDNFHHWKTLDRDQVDPQTLTGDWRKHSMNNTHPCSRSVITIYNKLTGMARLNRNRIANVAYIAQRFANILKNPNHPCQTLLGYTYSVLSATVKCDPMIRLLTGRKATPTLRSQKAKSSNNKSSLKALKTPEKHTHFHHFPRQKWLGTCKLPFRLQTITDTLCRGEKRETHKHN